ncbi:MAG: transposase [Phycisphaerales bacterium]|nr:transposase [Phycisphaerales bacterium]
MVRVARLVIPGVPHHITQRGNNRQDVFFVNQDWWVYLNFLAEECAAAVEVLGYCLMSNHVHLVLRPRREKGLACAVGRTHWRYSQYVNRLHARSGHLWQSQFYSCPLGPGHLPGAMRYVERNAVRAKLEAGAWRYRWSSARIHVGLPVEMPPEGLILPEVLAFHPSASAWHLAWSPAGWNQPDEQAGKAGGASLTAAIGGPTAKEKGGEDMKIGDGSLVAVP